MLILSVNNNAPFCLDANIFMIPWDYTHPIDIFQPLWSQMANKRYRMILLKPIYDEINPSRKKSGLRMWLKANNFVPAKIDSAVLNKSIEWEKKYDIKEKSKGVSVNDLILIAYAKIHGKTVVTLEAVQKDLPEKKWKYRIPAVCKQEQVRCINFIEMLRELKISI